MGKIKKTQKPFTIEMDELDLDFVSHVNYLSNYEGWEKPEEFHQSSDPEAKEK